MAQVLDVPSLEPGARSDGNEPIQAALESIAISLKRIADAVAPTEGLGFSDHISTAIYNGMAHGADAVAFNLRNR